MKLKLNHQESHGYCANGRFFNEPKSQHGRIHETEGKPQNDPHHDATDYKNAN